VNKVGFREEQEWWEPLSNLKYKDPYVMKLVKNYDDKMKNSASGVDLRPITETEVRLHLQDYGIEDELATAKLKGFSGGQKSRVVLAAAMWNRPHLIALDEPTNYLDKETMNALVRALKAFKGAVLVISHNAGFVEDVTSEKWTLNGGRVSVKSRKELAAEAGADGDGDGDAGDDK